MKGYELIVLANAVVFLLVGTLTLVNGRTIAQGGFACPYGNVTRCDSQVRIGLATQEVAPYLLATGVVLGGVGSSLVLYRRWYGKALSAEQPAVGP